MTEGSGKPSPYSTGGGGHDFEVRIQTSFLVLMLTGGYAPGLPPWPITEVQLQGRVKGYETDDVIVTVSDDKETRRLLGAITSTDISITVGDAKLGKILGAMWKDFENRGSPARGDTLALITGPMSGVDMRSMGWILRSARSHAHEEFFRRVDGAASDDIRSKLEAIRRHLRVAKEGEVSCEELHSFLRSFAVFSYSFEAGCDVSLPLLHSHMAQFSSDIGVEQLWSSLFEYVSRQNKEAAEIDMEKLREDLPEVVRAVEKGRSAARTMPDDLKDAGPDQDPSYAYESAVADELVKLVMVGGWIERNEGDIGALAHVLGVEPGDAIQKARSLHSPVTPLAMKSDRWALTAEAKKGLWPKVGPQMYRETLERSSSAAVQVLRSYDESSGRPLHYSSAVRRGLAEGLAILGTRPEACDRYSASLIRNFAVSAVRDVLTDAEPALWKSLGDVLPTLAEASPEAFLDAVEDALNTDPCPLLPLLQQDIVIGVPSLPSLLAGLQVLAWSEEYFGRSCRILGRLAALDPGDGYFSDGPVRALITVLLPWFPQSLASVSERKGAVDALARASKGVAWDVVLGLLPNETKMSLGSAKPAWKADLVERVAGHGDTKVKRGEYADLVNHYALLAVELARGDAAKLVRLVRHLGDFPHVAREALIGAIRSGGSQTSPAGERQELWDRLMLFHKSRSRRERYRDSEEAAKVKQTLEALKPQKPTELHRHLFSKQDHTLYESGDFREEEKKLSDRRRDAVAEILNQEGIEALVGFAQSAGQPWKVGYALAKVSPTPVENELFPAYLEDSNWALVQFLEGFARGRHQDLRWEWCDGLAGRAGSWTSRQKGIFLSLLPFSGEAWERVEEWLGSDQEEYWSRVYPQGAQGEDLRPAVEKFAECGRWRAAVDCLHAQSGSGELDAEQCLRVLKAAADSDEPLGAMDEYYTTELLGKLRGMDGVSNSDIAKVEWAYLRKFKYRLDEERRFVALERELAENPSFFHELLSIAFRPVEEPPRELGEREQDKASGVWLLLATVWAWPPGWHGEGEFSEQCWNEWWLGVREKCRESGHSMKIVGELVGGAIASLTWGLLEEGSDEVWFAPAIARAMEQTTEEAVAMRAGYRAGIVEARGAHYVDTTGGEEEQLAKKCHQRARWLQSKGFPTFAQIWRELAASHEAEAESLRESYGEDDD